MGQTSSLACCCCDRDRRASAVLNDPLQEKLLADDDNDEQLKTTATTAFAESLVTDSSRHSLHSKQSSPRTAGTASGMMPLSVESEDDGSDGRASRDRMDEEDDEEDTDGQDRTTKSLRGKKQLSSSYRPSVNEWDLARESAFDIESVEAQLETLPSERDLEDVGRGSMSTRLARGTNDASNRDSYASTRELMETTLEGDEEGGDVYNDDDADDGADPETPDGDKLAAVQDAVLRRRPMPRPTSSRVFDDEADAGRPSSQSSTSRGLRELAEQDAESEDFGSYGSGSSSMHSFLQRHSDIDSSGVSLIESEDVGDDITALNDPTESGNAPSPPKSGSRSPHRSGSKKKGKKRR